MERWQQIESLFREALERDPAERNAWLQEACLGDSELQREVASLLANHHGATDFKPRAVQAAQLIHGHVSLRAGQRLGPYEIVAPIGAGGMGEVYRARDTRLDRIVAIKISSARFSERFKHESRAIAALNHPHICTLYDIGPDYLVMEYIDGAPIRGPLPVDRALKLATQIADALDAAHRKGIIHRDLKPANILVTKSGVKLLDFGLAEMHRVTTPSSETVSMKQGDSLVGTLRYMAPEQLRGSLADPRSDIFAFGLVFYELLTGQHAFVAESPANLIAAILTAEPPSVTKLQPLAPPPLGRLLQRALAKDPDERWQSARDLKAEIEWIAEARGNQLSAGPAAPAVRPRKNWFGWAVATAVIAVLAAIGWTYLRERTPPQPLVRFEVGPPPGERFCQFYLPNVSPDGQKILFGAEPPGGTPRLWIRRIASGESTPFQNLPYQFGRWCADSNSFAVFTPPNRGLWPERGDAVLRIDLATGATTEILKEQVYDFAWAPNGSFLFGVRNKGLFWAASGSERKQLTVQSPSEGLHINPQVLPRGKGFLFEKQRSHALETWFAKPDGSSPKRLLIKTTQALYTPPGYLLYLDGDSLVAKRFDADLGRVTGDPRTLAMGVAHLPNDDTLGMFSVSHNGVLVFRKGSVINPGRLTWFDRNGNVVGTVGEIADYSNPALSLDGNRLAVSIRDSSGKRDIWVIDLRRGITTRLTFDPTDETNPVWSPDGSEIVYSSDRNGHRDLYARSSFGTGPERVLLESSDDKSPLDWSRDGRFLFFSVLNPKTGRDLWILPMAGNDRRPSLFLGTQFREDYAAVSPESRWVLFRSDESGRPALYVQPLPANGQRWIVSDSDAAEAQWRGDGREFFYISYSGNLMGVEITLAGPAVRPGAPKKLFQLPSRGLLGRNRFVVSPDGRRFLAIVPSEPRDDTMTPFVVILNWQRLLEN
jgi:Tol biopolymer transport system component